MARPFERQPWLSVNSRVAGELPSHVHSKSSALRSVLEISAHVVHLVGNSIPSVSLGSSKVSLPVSAVLCEDD